MKRIALLDYGRFFAAISVVVFHYFFNGINNGKITSITHINEVIDITKYGYLGVNFFFIISGYVIFFSAKNRSASQFVVSRAVRLYPAFWAAVIFTSFFAIFWGGEQMAVSPALILSNFTMVSPLFGHGFVDGVYWTLMYELEFYALVCVFLSFGAQKYLDKIFLLWPIIIALAVYFGKDNIIYLGGYFCYFSAGIILAIFKDKKSLLHYFSLILIAYLCITFSTDKAYELSQARNISYSKTIISFIISLFFIFFIFVTTKTGANLKLRGSKLLGGLTYPVYLIHAHFGYMFISQYATDNNKTIIYALTITIVISVSYAIHVFIEKRYFYFWKNLFVLAIGKPIETINNKIRACKI